MKAEMCFLCRFVVLRYPWLESQRDEDPEQAATLHAGNTVGECHRPCADP
jgi:hypothetical protein